MIKKVIDAIRNGLYEETNLFVVDTDIFEKKPNYPFYSYKITSLIQNDGQAGMLQQEAIESTEEGFEFDLKETLTLDSKFIISFNSYSNNLLESQSYAIKAWEWFKFRGKQYLEDYKIVVVDIGNIQDRTINIVDNYEYRQGFDIELRVLHKINRRTRTIENYKIEGGKH